MHTHITHVHARTYRIAHILHARTRIAPHHFRARACACALRSDVAPSFVRSYMFLSFAPCMHKYHHRVQPYSLDDNGAFQEHCMTVEHDDEFAYDCEMVQVCDPAARMWCCFFMLIYKLPAVCNILVGTFYCIMNLTQFMQIANCIAANLGPEAIPCSAPQHCSNTAPHYPTALLKDSLKKCTARTARTEVVI